MASILESSERYSREIKTLMVNSERRNKQDYFNNTLNLIVIPNSLFVLLPRWLIKSCNEVYFEFYELTKDESSRFMLFLANAKSS